MPEKDMKFEDNNFVPPEEGRYTTTVSISGIMNWLKKKKKKDDIDKITEYENIIKNSDERQDL
jgi:hypothetical protein